MPWYHDYQPKTVNDCILSPKLKKDFNKIISSGVMNSMIFAGSAGIGKTTVAKCLANELQSDVLLINSSNAGIDVIRTDVTQFATGMSMSEGSHKIVIFDESDALTELVQKSLRAFIDEFVETTRFIFTCNYPHKLIPALHSRCPFFDFEPDDKVKTSAILASKIAAMCKDNDYKCDTKSLHQFCMQLFPDFRATINACQVYAESNGQIDSGILSIRKSNVDELVEQILNKDFNAAREIIVQLTGDVYSPLYVKMTSSQPQLANKFAVIIAKYNFYSTHSVVQDVTLAACVAELIDCI